MGRYVILMALMFLAGCQTPQGQFCDIAKPIRLSPEVVDTMTDAEVEKVLAFNEKGQAMCGWKP